MNLRIKICGLKTAETVAAAVSGDAAYLGFVFYPPSPRAVSAQDVAQLLPLVPSDTKTVGLFVNPTDAELSAVLRVAPLSHLQLHGQESPQRVQEIKAHTGLPVIKAVGIAEKADLATARLYENVADILLLDAKPAPGILPGGNAQRFDWKLLQGVTFSCPWMLAGGLTAENIKVAVQVTGAIQLDVSSGVEDSPGQKSPQKITAFLAKARHLETCC